MKGEFSTFIMSETTLNQIKALPPEKQLQFFWAVADYGVDGIEPEFDGVDLAVWIPMRDLILHTKRKDEIWRLKRQENGKKGGRPKAKTDPDEPAGTQENLLVISENQENQENLLVISASNDNVNDNENLNVNVKLGKPLINTKEIPRNNFENIRQVWNFPDRKLPEFRRTILQLTSPERDIISRQFVSYQEGEIIEAIKNYSYMRLHPEEFDIKHNYSGLISFIEKGLDTFTQPEDVLQKNFKRRTK
jgi:hypothetical protein